MLKFNRATLLNLNPYNDNTVHGKISKNSNTSIIETGSSLKDQKKLNKKRHNLKNNDLVGNKGNTNYATTTSTSTSNNNNAVNKYASDSSSVTSVDSKISNDTATDNRNSIISRNSINILNTINSKNKNIINKPVKKVQFEEEIKPLRFKMNIQNDSITNNDSICDANNVAEYHESIDLIKSKLSKFKVDSQLNLSSLTESNYIQDSNTIDNNNILFSNSTLNIGLIDKNQFINYLEKPKYIKLNQKKGKVDSFNRLFLAQELNTDINNSNNIIFENDKSNDKNSIYNYDNKNPKHNNNIPKNDSIHNNIQNSNSLKLRKSISSTNSSNDIIMNKKAVWKLQFNKNGKFMASANKDGSIRIWKVLSSPIERWEVDSMEEQHDYYKLKKKNLINKEHDNNSINKTNLNIDTNTNNSTENENLNLYAPVFNPKPVQTFMEHSENILDIDWSKNDFLITGSMDKLVKIWHLEKKQSLKTFIHSDFVTGVKFHPLDDRFFISSCLDHIVRLWSIIDNEICYEFDCKDLITCLTVSEDGKYTIIGTFNGFIYILSTKGLKPITSFHVIDKGTQGKHAIPVISPNYLKGKLYKSPRVTGLDCVSNTNEVISQKDKSFKLIVTTADSRIRIFDLQTRSLLKVLKGFQSGSSPHQAKLVNWNDSSVVITSSEDHWIYGWELDDFKDYNASSDYADDISKSKVKKEKKNIVSKITNRITNKHHDNDIGDTADKRGSLIGRRRTTKNNSKSLHFHAHHHPVTNAVLAPLSTTKTLSLSNDFICELYTQYSKEVPHLKKKIFDPSDTIGPILVTSDTQGLIRIFRVDMPKEIRECVINELKHSTANLKNGQNNKNSVNDSKNSLTVNRGKVKSKIRNSFDNILNYERSNHRISQENKYRKKHDYSSCSENYNHNSNSTNTSNDNNSNNHMNNESIDNCGTQTEVRNKRTSFSIASAIFNKSNKSENSSINSSSKHIINENDSTFNNSGGNNIGNNNSRKNTNTSMITLKCEVCNGNKFETITSNNSVDGRSTYCCVDCGTILNNLR